MPKPHDRVRSSFVRPLLVAFAIPLLAPVAQGQVMSRATPPNIVFMLSDDQAWDGLSVSMHPTLAGSKDAVCQTPNLERFAAEGMRFSAAYAPAPVCARRGSASSPDGHRLRSTGPRRDRR